MTFSMPVRALRVLTLAGLDDGLYISDSGICSQLKRVGPICSRQETAI